ncbi:MAG: hypothetical protein WCP35_02040 [Verrucomicrobiota bacterium]
MIIRFNTYEEASIYAGVMQADGHFAEILDECSGFMYGPLAIGGFRVIATEEPVVVAEGPPATGPLESALLNFLRLLVSAFVAFGLTLGIGLLSQEGGGFLLVVLLALVAASAGWLGLCLIMAPLMIPFTRALRDEKSAFGGLIKGTIACLFAGQYLFIIVALIYLLLSWLVGAFATL